MIPRRSVAVLSRLGGLRRGFADHIREGGGRWAEKEAAAEAKYFSKADHEALEKLLLKMKHQSSPQTREKHAETLEEIFEHHGLKLTDAIIKDLVAWKTGHH